MATNWARMVHTSFMNYLRKEEPAILRNRRVTAMIEDMGRVSFNNGGVGGSESNFQWEVEFKLIQPDPYADMDVVQPARHDLWKNATLPYRGYNVSDGISKFEKLANRGETALVNLWDGRTKRLTKAMKEYFPGQLYLDGNAAGNEKRVHGIESFMGAGSTAGYVKTPSDTFAGIDTTPGAYNATWSVGTWPDGTGDAHYDFWSPIIIDSTATAFASGATFATYGVEVIRKLRLFMERNSTAESQPDAVILDGDSYFTFLNLLDDKERVTVQQNAQQSRLVKLGFGSVVNMDGMDVTWEYGLPANVKGYGWNFKKLEIRSMQPTMFAVEGPEWHGQQKLWVMDVDFFGNIEWASPRYFGKIV